MNSHNYIFYGAVIFFALLLIYIFMDHQVQIVDENIIKIFKKAGLTADQIKNISHDDSMWYYRGYSTCVLFKDYKNPIVSWECPEYEGYCSGLKGSYGSLEQQARAIKDSINNGGEHPHCPLIYSGAE
ncbi:hypothetical protein OAG24_00500 [bacterium]|nr:hypothetical protein [bacterium]